MSAGLTELPALQFEIPPKPAIKFGREGELKWLPLAKLRIDPSYQRDVGAAGKRNIKRIVENFSWSLFSPVVVSPRPGGLYAIIDGQHRAIAARENGGIKTVPCLVLETDAAGEARAFAAINGLATRITSLSLYRARLAARDDSAIKIDRVCKRAGVTIAPYAYIGLKPGETLAVVTIERMIQKFGETAVETALTLIVRSADGGTGLLRDGIIKALARVLYHHPKWAAKPDAARSALEKKGLRELFLEAVKKAAEDGGTQEGNLEQLLAATFRAALGDGGKPAIVETAREKKRREERAEQARAGISLGLRRSPGGGAPKKIAASNRASANEKDAIAAFLAKKQPRRFESGATGNTSDLLDWLNVHAKRSAKRVGGQQRGSKPYEVDGKRYDFDGFIALVNRERKKRDLEPLTLHERRGLTRQKEAA